MIAPVFAVDICIAYGVSTMYHHSVPNINANVRNRSATRISTLKEDNIPRLSFAFWNTGGLIVNARSCGAWDIAHTGLIDYPTHKATAIKRSRWRAATPNIGVA